MTYKIIPGNNIDVLKTYPDNHFDSIVTDPPYGIDFLGKAWDANTGALETYQECLRVLKPGGHILAFSAARTYHHLAYTLEVAGFEIRDQIMWIYSSGFPKSQDIGKSIDRSLKKGKFIKTGKTRVSGGPKENPNGPLPRSEETIHIPESEGAKQWSGWGTQLKPAHEPICMARKPIRGSIAKNCQQWGTGAINVDATRVPYEDEADMKEAHVFCGTKTSGMKQTFDYDNRGQISSDSSVVMGNIEGRFPSNVIGEIPDYQKYFYCPKVSRRERHTGFDLKEMPTIGNNNGNPMGQLAGDKSNALKNVEQDTSEKGNNHPTVKPIELMKYLIKLVTKPGGLVLDPFNGSGSTGCAAVELGYDYTGIELDPKYVEIAEKRIAAWKNTTRLPEIFEYEHEKTTPYQE